MGIGLKKRRWLVVLGAALGLGLLALWLLPFCREQRHLYFRDYTFTAAEADRLERHADILFAHARRAESRLDTTGAAELYRRVTARNPLHMEAWLRLAEMTAAAGDLAGARRIAAFCNAYIGPVLRWKWPHTLLAHHLDLPDIFAANINYLVARGNRLNDALFLLDTHCRSDAQRALALLAPDNHAAYLDWAIRWKNAAAVQAGWQALTAGGRVTDELRRDYVHFQLARKDIAAAVAARPQAAGTGMTNGGFEDEITGKGFDWRTRSDREGRFEIARKAAEGRGGGAALRIGFDGGANVAFHHVYQVVPVKPETPHRVAFWWRDKGLSTDQVPFVEVYGYDAKGLYARSEPLQGAREWQAGEVVFTPPPGCRAVVVRVRRLISRRFDNKIRGSVWLDEFSLVRSAEF